MLNHSNIKSLRRFLVGLSGLLTLLFGFTLPRAAQAAPATDHHKPKAVLGVKAGPGGRFDNVRMCVATAAGVKGGPSFDVSFYAEFPLSKGWSVALDLPVFRPAFFGASFKMLQFEPEVTFAYRVILGRKVDLMVGPSLGLTFHYGPDYRSANSGTGRLSSFFAMGPRIGGYVGLDFKRPGKVFNFQLGLRPYVTPLFGIGDPEDHLGVVVGGQLEALFRFAIF